MAELKIFLPDQTTRQVDLTEETITVGRDASCELSLPDMDVSRQHMRIAPRADGSYVLEDLASTNHTYVNDQIIHVHNLAHGDEITLGRTRILYRTGETQSTIPAVTMTDVPAATHNLAYASRTDRLKLSQQRLNLLYKLVDRLTSLRDRDVLLEDAMDVCFDMLQFERGVIALRETPETELETVLVRNRRGDESDITISRTLLDRSLLQGERVIVNDPRSDGAVPTHSMVESGLVSAMCVPIRYDDRILGVIYGDRITTRMVYEPEDVDFLAAIAKHLSVGLTNADLAKQQRQKDQLQRELSLARDIQRGLFPKKLPDLETVKMAAISDPGLQVSGDYYDLITLPENQIGVVIADVSGKGVSAALLMANLQAAVRVTLPRGLALDDLVQEWNKLIIGNTDGSRFITMLAGILEPDTRTFRYVLAGHFSPYLVHADGRVEETPSSPGLPLGILESEKYPISSIQVPPGPHTLFLYTDGLPEAFNEQRQLFENERVVALLERCASQSADELVTSVREAIKSFAGKAPQSDDITLLAIKFK